MSKEEIQELARQSADQHFNAKHEGDWYAHYYGFIYGFQKAEEEVRDKAIQECIEMVIEMVGNTEFYPSEVAADLEKLKLKTP